MDTHREDNCTPIDFAAPNDITLAELLRFLGSYPIAKLAFRYDGRLIRPGYHVTEVKAGQFSALDVKDVTIRPGE